MKQYAINFSFKNGTVICVKSPKTNLEVEDVVKEIEEKCGVIGEFGNYYGINMDNLNYYTAYELRDSEVEEETPAHTED